MTEKIFWQNPYQTELTSTVTAVDGKDVTLSETIIFAESGGQESDTGTIDGIEVVKATKIGPSIVYTLASGPDFNVGDQVISVIEWDRRYALMKLHFAAELVLELLTRHNPGMHKIGAHISEDKSRLDFAWPENISPLLPGIQRQTQTLIDADLVIESHFSDRIEERRYWRIEDFAQVSCGGTHLRKTSEVGRIRLKRKNIGREKERVEISLA